MPKAQKSNKMEKKEKFEFNVQDMLPLAMIVVVTAIGVAFGLQIMGDVKTDMTANSAEANATGDGITAVGKFTSKLGTIVTVIVAAILIGILVRYLFVRFQ